ncbi:pantoate kinase [Methanobrevibacter millerae]|uniref:Pantoate kinase n=1 Tax=Methanobrevibacter millerae TaxID=230361 RepID=A0A1G5VM13_9EURY|nr:pantoate kinase [Methanobrevibacter millerae]SDA46941.1 pantoate kinase [Methanobrevibacter millerae]
MRISHFTPAHITGFFSIENNPDPLINGSCGAGFLLDKGVESTVRDSSEFKINVNRGSDIVINEVLKHFDADKSFEIIQDIQVPIGAGFGTSAASALSLAIALNEFLDFNHSYIECGQIAHKVDIALGGGLGDVIAQTGSGIVLRTSPGAPGIGKIESFDDEFFIATKTFGEISTASVITNPEHKKLISSNGRECLSKFKRNPSVDNFLRLSLEFSQNTKLMSDEVKNLVDYLNSSSDISGASMAMLGNTAFAFADNESSFKDLKIEGLDIYKLYTRDKL